MSVTDHCLLLPDDAPSITERLTVERFSSPTAIGPARLRVPRVKAVPRPRLDAILDRAWDHRVTLVLAPAGSGKTTAVAAFAHRSGRPVAWIAGTGLGSTQSFIGHLNAAVQALVPGVVVDSPSVEGAADAMLQVTEPFALVVDDVHMLVGTPAEAALAELIELAPDSLRIVLAGRREPGFGLGRIRLMGDLLLVQSEELRFRTWEAEQLFRDLYDTWLRPDDIARLAQRVDGWAAGLQMFHLAARGLSPVDQRRLIDRLNGRARIVREFLVANVLEPISPELRTFLVDTCVVSVVTPDLADALCGSSGSEHHLRELARGQLFTTAVDDDSYRYHEVLRAQLEVMLLERDGEHGAADRYRTAGRLLEERGLHQDALHCFARAADWSAVRRLVGPTSERARPPSMAWIRDLPPSIVADDPWLLLARSRAEYLAGRWDDANESFHSAASKGIGAEFAAQCRPAHAALAAWLNPMALAPDGWIGTARAGCHRDPLTSAEELERDRTTVGLIAASALRLIAGDVEGARRSGERALNDDTAGEFEVAAGMLVLACADLIAGLDDAADSLDEAETYAERSGFGWLARLARAGLSLTDRPNGVDEATRVREQCIADGDPWGAAISALLGGLGASRRGAPASSLLSQAARHFRVLDARALEALCVSALASTAGSDIHDAASIARSVGVGGTTRLIDDFVNPSKRHDDEVPLDDVGPLAPADTDPLRVRCLGQFAVAVHGKGVDLEGLRPRARALLKLLAINPGNGLHRETIVDALWPDSTAEAGIRNLQVAVSAIRRAFAQAGLPDQFGIRRQGESYRLVVATVDASDLAQFLELSSTATTAAARGDDEAAMTAAVSALALYRGELLVEDGPLEFIIRERSRVSALRQTLAVIVAEGYIGRELYRAAIDVCEATIVEHPYADELWRLLVQSHQARGDSAAAGKAQARYEHVLAELMT